MRQIKFRQTPCVAMDFGDFSPQNIGVDFFRDVWYLDIRNQNEGGGVTYG